MQKLVIALSLITLASCTPKANNSRAYLINSSIINGLAVKETELIAQSVVGVYNIKEKSLCTGTLIAPNIVLTAAHCAPERISDLKIIFTTDIDDIITSHEQDILQEFILSATDFKAGPTWDPKNKNAETDTGDIALIKFKGKIPVGFKAALFLSDENFLRKGNMAIVAGFGVNTVTTTTVDPKINYNIDEAIESGEAICDEDSKGNKTNCFEIDTDGDGILRYTAAPISSLSESEIQLDERKAGTCSGDSGGPAFINQNGQLYLFGVTSRGSVLCNEVGIYTNALHYRPWITRVIALLK
jgi:hypothetical protein